MNHLIALFFLICFSFSLQSQTETNKKEWHFGVAINSGFALSAGALNTNPTGTFYINRHQVELGFGFYPLNTKKSNDLRLMGGQLNYKFYPNGIHKRFSLYFMNGLTYTYKVGVDKHLHIDDLNQYVITTQNKDKYLSLISGFGFDVKIFKNGYMGSCLNFGLTTSNSSLELLSTKHFQTIGLNGALRLNIGYRF
jgi:hypothetical protein